jgi:hypothetical protein
MQSSALQIHKWAFEFHSGELAPAGAKAQGVMKLLISAHFVKLNEP